MNLKITILPGDGVGAEVTREAVRLLKDAAAIYGYRFTFEEKLIGGAALKATGSPLPTGTLDACLASDAVLLGAVGAPEFDNLPHAQKPEKGLLLLRQALGGFANLRPSRAYLELLNSAPLRPEIIAGADILCVRELLGGLYFGEPRGITNAEDYNDLLAPRMAFNTMRYETHEIARVAHVAFRAAQKRRGRVTSVDKANVLETSRLWRETVIEVAREYPDVNLEHLYVDACAMALVTNPTRFDVLLTENLFGDILSDEASVLTGSLGMLPSATIGGAVDLYEPVHGSAPDIAGRNIANPLGAIASAAMLLRYTAQMEEAAQALDDAIARVLADGWRTADIAHGTTTRQILSTTEMGARVAEAFAEIADHRHAYHAV